MFSTSSNVIENIGKNGTEGGPQEDLDVSCLPVTELSWREIARMVFVYDVLTGECISLVTLLKYGVFANTLPFNRSWIFKARRGEPGKRLQKRRPP